MSAPVEDGRHAPADLDAAPGGDVAPAGGAAVAGGSAGGGATGAGTLRERVVRGVVQSLGIGVFYVVVLVYFSSRTQGFLSVDNLAGIAAVAAPLGIVAVGQTIAIISGGFDLSVGGVLPLGAVTFGAASTSMSLVPATLVAIAVGAVVGTGNGLVIERLGINPFICTLATLSVSGGLAYVVTDGVTEPISPDLGLWGDTAFGQVQYGVLAFAGLALAAAVVLRWTTFGRAVYAVGGNREAAELAGLRVRSLTVGVYAISGLCAGFAGAVTASQLLAAAPNVGATVALDSVAAVIVGGAALFGGVGGVVGTVLGVLLLGTVANGLSLLQVPTFYQTMITGIILLLAVSFARLRDVLLSRRSS